MTIDQLVELDADEWDKLSDAQLMEIFKPFLSVTRPEIVRANRPKQSITMQNKPVVIMDERKQKALAMLASEGMDMSFLNRMRTKRK